MAMTGGTAKLLKTTYPFTNTSKAVSLYAYYKTTQNIETNESTIYCGMYVTTPSGWDIGSWQDKSGSYIGTTSNTFSGYIPNFSGTRWLTENQTFTVKHNDDGTGSATIYWRWGVNSPWGGYVYPTGSFSITLPTIARPSVPTASNDDATMGSEIRIYTNRASEAFTHTLKYTFGNASGTIATGVGASYKWKVPDLAHECNNAGNGKATITCITYNGSELVGTKTLSLQLFVPYNTTPSIPNGIVIGAGNPITTAAASSNFKHLLTYNFNGVSGAVNSDKVASGIVWWTPYDLATAIPRDKSGEGTITCKTYNGTYQVGNGITIPFTATVPDNATTKPKLTDLSLSPSGTLPSAFDGLYVQRKTGVKGVFTDSSEYSLLSTRYLTVNGKSYVNYNGNTVTSDIFTQSGTVKIKATVDDARGYVSEPIEETFEVLPYDLPSIQPYSGESAIICERCTSDGTLSEEGTYLRVKAKRVYSKVMSGAAQKNFCTLQYRYKASNSSAYSNPVTLLDKTATADEVNVTLAGVVESQMTSYLVQLIVTDTIGETISYTFDIPTASTDFHLREGGDGGAFGKYAEKEGVLECEWDGEFNKNLRVAGSMTAGHIKSIAQYDSLDFNELIYSTGYYVGTSAPSTTGCSNYPIDKTGILEVISAMKQNVETLAWWGFAYQTYRSYDGQIYTRSYFIGEGWTPWKKIATA